MQQQGLSEEGASVSFVAIGGILGGERAEEFSSNLSFSLARSHSIIGVSKNTMLRCGEDIVKELMKNKNL